MKSDLTRLSSILLTVLFLSLGLARIAGPAGAQDGAQVYLPAVFRQYDPRWAEPLPLALEPAPDPTSRPLLVIDGRDRLHVLWDSGKEPRLIYHSIHNGTRWSDPAPIAETQGYSTLLYPPLVDGDGGLHLVWYNRLGAGIEVPHGLLYAHFDGNGWQPDTVLWRSNNPDLQAMAHRGLGDALHVTLLDGTVAATETYQLTWTLLGWTSSGNIQPNGFANRTWPDNEGGVHFYGIDYTRDYGLIYSHWQGGQWPARNVALPGTVYGRETQFDAAQNLLTYWTGTVPVAEGPVIGLYTQCLDDALAWEAELVVSGQQAVATTNTRILKAAGRLSGMALVWEEEAPALFRVALWEGCAPEVTQPVPYLDPAGWEPVALALGPAVGPGERVCVLAQRAGMAGWFGVVCGTIW